MSATSENLISSTLHMRDLDLDAISTAFFDTVARIAPGQLDLARQTLERIPPGRWQIEWYLPWWLGEAYGLDRDISCQFVLSNVLGLAAVRLEDDLADGDHPETTRLCARSLSTALVNAALAIYQPYFHPDSVFWTKTHASLACWQAAAMQPLPPSVDQFDPADQNALTFLSAAQTFFLKQLGAPLKVGALAVCLLTRQENAFEQLNAALDHAFIAAVLYDHAMDCHADLDAGRWNFFVAAVSPFSQTAPFLLENHSRIVQAWTLGGTPRSYFEQIAYHIELARQKVHVPGLSDYLDQFLINTWGTFEHLKQHYHNHLAEVTNALFGALHESEPMRTPK